MDSLLQYFENFPDHNKLIWIFICLTIFWGMETLIPRYQFFYKKWKHAGVNLFFLATSVAINLLMAVLLALVFLQLDKNHFGLLYLVDWPSWAELILSVSALDLVAQYFSHYLLHKVKWMWKFHMVHHSDTHVDVTTGTRHHPGDYLIREIFSLLVIVLTGMPFAYYLIYRLTTVFFTYWTHANIKMPLWLEKSLSLIFVTPDLHKFHHHYERPWTDTNFGNVFSIWDRIFGTLVYDDPTKIRFGLDVLDHTTSQRIKYQLLLPFNNDVKTDD